jgi:signal transduction histidine kinase
VAWQWRIRHKLMLGLGLVVGVMSLLLAGTLEGLLAYASTVKSIDSKLTELSAAEDLKETVADLRTPDPRKADELANLRKKIAEGCDKLAAYEQRLRDTLTRRRDPNKGVQEKGLVTALRERFGKLEQAAKKSLGTEATPLGSTEEVISEYKDPVSKAIEELTRASTDLREEIYHDLNDRIRDARTPYRLSMWIVLSTSIVGGLLMIGLLRFFYGWVFYPIRDLERGVNRVAQGDFAHRIEVHSGDEMEDLAAAFNDMTGRLREMYRDLAHQVNERSRQLVRSERLASVGFLAAGVAHEINNPLASIAFCSEALESRLSETSSTPPINNEVVSKYLKMIQAEAFRCKAITSRLLEFSRSGERRREPNDLAELVQSVLDMVQHLQNYKDKQIIFEPTGRVSAWINAQEIKSVVLNLVVNALDSMDDNGTLTIALEQRDGMAEIVFADTGCGMSPEILENIFEPFFTRSRTGKGTGLGLSISHRIVTQHGGEIEATSAGLDQGSTFTVRLPMRPAESAKEETFGHAAAA